jgi:hypothetical protein
MSNKEKKTEPFDFNVVLVSKDGKYAFEYTCPTSSNTTVKGTFYPNQLDNEATRFVEECREAYQKSTIFGLSNL